MNTIQVSTKELMKLPLHILQRIAGSKSRNKLGLATDIAFHLESKGITFIEAAIDDEFIRIEYNGKKIGAIDTTRGRQEFVTLSDTSDNWRTDWEALILGLFASIELRKQEEFDCMEYDDLAEDAEDVMDPSVSADERTLMQRYPKSADRIIENLGERFEVQTERDLLQIVDVESGNVILEQHNPDSQTWKAYLTNGEFYTISNKPVGWMRAVENGKV